MHVADDEQRGERLFCIFKNEGGGQWIVIERRTAGPRNHSRLAIPMTMYLIPPIFMCPSLVVDCVHRGRQESMFRETSI